MIVYLDTSAAAKLLIEEDESPALAHYLDGTSERDVLVSSAVLETELRRVAVRVGLTQDAVSQVLARVALAEAPRSLFFEAGVLPGDALRSLDALHLATALRVEADVVVAYDRRLLDAAAAFGLDVVAPT